MCAFELHQNQARLNRLEHDGVNGGGRVVSAGQPHNTLRMRQRYGRWEMSFLCKRFRYNRPTPPYDFDHFHRPNGFASVTLRHAFFFLPRRYQPTESLSKLIVVPLRESAKLNRAERHRG